MTRHEALAEAHKRWGTSSELTPRRWPMLWNHRSDPSPRRRFQVGYYQEWSGGSREVFTMGTGDSWETAFRDADKRAEFRKMNDIGNAHFRIGPGRMV